MLCYDNWTRAEIDLDALTSNLGAVKRRLAPGCRVMAMVKADAYGHGAIPVARELEAAGADFFGVANIFEAVSLREAGVRSPIFVAGYTPAPLVVDLLRHDITQCVPDLGAAREYSAAALRSGAPLRVHIKVDTGMSRYGIPSAGREEEAADEVMSILALPNLKVCGILTHFASSDDPEPEPTAMQLASFRRVLDILARRGVNNLVKHCANSAAVLQYGYTHFDMVRTGLALYGLETVPGSAPELRPVMTLKTPLTQVKEIPAGAGVSYGMDFRAPRPMRVATVPIGYGDGYSRAYQGAVMTVRGRPARVLGRICMDITVIDVTDIPDASVGDDAVALGAPPFTTAGDLAKIAGTIQYEVVTGISKRVLRLYSKGGQNISRLVYI